MTYDLCAVISDLSQEINKVPTLLLRLGPRT